MKMRTMWESVSMSTPNSIIWPSSSSLIQQKKEGARALYFEIYILLSKLSSIKHSILTSTLILHRYLCLSLTVHLHPPYTPPMPNSFINLCVPNEASAMTPITTGTITNTSTINPGKQVRQTPVCSGQHSPVRRLREYSGVSHLRQWEVVRHRKHPSSEHSSQRKLLVSTQPSMQPRHVFWSKQLWQPYKLH